MKSQGKVANKWKPQIDLDLGDSARNALNAAESQKLRPQKFSARPRFRLIRILAFSWFSCGLYWVFYGYSTCLLCVTSVAVSAAVRLRKCIPIFARRAATMPRTQRHTHPHTVTDTHTHTHTRGDTKTKTETSARKLRSFKSPTFKNWLSGRIGIMTLRCPNFQLYILNSNRSGFWIAIEVIAATSRPRQHWPGLVSVSGFSCWPHDSEAKRRLKSASWRTRCYIREVLRLNPPSAEWWVSQRTSHQDFGLRAIELLPVTVNGYFSCAEAARMQQFSVSQPEFDYPSKIRENLCFKWTKMELMLTK